MGGEMQSIDRWIFAVVRHAHISFEAKRALVDLRAERNTSAERAKAALESAGLSCDEVSRTLVILAGISGACTPHAPLAQPTAI
jgi:hypothetical protein